MNTSKKSVYEVNDNLVKDEQYTDESRRYPPRDRMPEGGLDKREWIATAQSYRR